MATPQVKDLVLRSPAGSTEVISFTWPLQIGSGQDKHDNGIDIIDTIKFVCDELPGISSAFEEINLNQIDTACHKTMTNLVDRFNKAVDSIVALEKGTSLPAERLNKFAHPSLLRHILQLVYNAAVLDPDKLNNYEPFSPEVYGETSYELVQQMIKHVNVTNEDTFIDLGSGVGQVVLQMAGSFPLKACIGIEKADTPALYAVRMDRYFRQFMAWFGKRFCEYKLIKGDFLMDEHRENITSSTLVFVNNFAFGPNVDHQLKERFADLRDGAKVVSSKSFCPLNFRITDRNLSDIGTIMHVSEIPPLKGSVSWTCKPVSYYLHVIDRTILERYFQRMKTQKGADNEHVGTSRTTRDRAKRDAGGQQQQQQQQQQSLQHINNNAQQMNLLRCAPSPTFMNSNNNSTTNSVMTNGLKSRQCQLDMMDTSTESEGESAMMLNGAGISRKNWSDWCNQKREKSSQSEDDNNNNNFIGARGRLNNGGGGGGGGNSSGGVSTTKKRKKLTRKAAVATKGAFAVINVNKENKEEAATNNANRGRKGRLKKGARGRKSLKIVGLDVLHKQTLLSTSVELLSKKLPPAPGCVDQQLTSLLTGDMSHTELEIPTAPRKTPYALQILLDVLRGQYMSMMEHMRSPHYELQVQDQIKMEQKRKQNLKNRASQLEKQIKVLIDDSVALLRTRMTELGISVSSPNELIAKAKEIVGRHKELQIMAKRIQGQVNACEMEQKQLIKQQMQQMPVCKSKLECLDLCEATAHDLVLKEIANTLTQRKKLYAQVATLQQEAATLERQHNMLINAVTTSAAGSVSLNRTTSAASAAVVGTKATTTTSTCMTTAVTSVICATSGGAGAVGVDNICDNQPLQLTVSHKNKVATTILPTATTNASKFNKSPRRQQARGDLSATQRLRGQEWPDVPDVGKIEESNPEVLAQKILETGRKIEAGKFMPQQSQHQQQQHIDDKNNISRKNVYNNNKRYTTYQENQQHQQHNQHLHADHVYQQQQQQHQQQQQQYYQQQQQQQATNVCTLPSIKESPKVANFEHRLKSIITSVLNEDQEQRKQQLHNTTSIYNMQPDTQKHYATTNNVLSIKRKHQTQQPTTTAIANMETPTVGHNNQRSSLLLQQQTSPTSNNISTFAHGIVTQKLNANKPIHQQQTPQMQHQQQQHNTATNLTMHHRRRATITAANLEQYTLQQQQQLKLQQHQQHNLEFKAPPHISHVAAREHLVEDYKDTIRPPRSNSAHSDTTKASVCNNNLNIIQPSTSANTLMKIAVPAAELNVIQLSRPNSNSSQPDYTQVSPAKIALRRHLSQEKLHQLQQTPPAVPAQQPQSQSQQQQQQQQQSQQQQANSFATKTIGDLVNGEIERTLEISHQSIINAVVNKSTVGNAVQGNNSAYERSLINPNAQRPERVNVRLLDDATTSAASRHTQQNGHNNGNLATLAQAAYNHKLMQATTNNVYQQQQQQQQQQQSAPVPISPRPYQTVALPRAEIKGCIEAYFNEDHNLQKPIQEQYQQQKQSHYAQQQQQSPIKEHNKIIKDQRLNSSTRMNRFNTVGSAPLEGLAASLQDHMLASRKFKEGQHEERQRRASILTNYNVEPTVAASASSSAATTSSMTIPANALEHHQYNQQQQQQTINGNFQQQQQQQQHQVNNMTTATNGIKRNSPTTSNQAPRPNKIAHYTHEPQKYTHPQQQQQQQQHNMFVCTNSSRNQLNLLQEDTHLTSRNKKLARDSILTTSPDINSMLSDERLKYHQQQQQQQQQQPNQTNQQQQQLHCQQISQSLTIQHMQHHHQQQLANNNRNNTPINVVGSGRAADDDDLIIDDETHWQHRVSSGFDRLVAFASTELHKTRHSIDTVDTGSTSKSCNTSPDSGIAHSSSSSSSTSEGSRVYLNAATKTLDLRLNSNGNGSIKKGFVSPTANNNNNMQSCESKPLASEDNTATRVTTLHAKSLELNSATVTASVIESPPLSDMGLPRTPSPSAVVSSSPLIMGVPIRPPTPPNSANSNSNASSSDVLNTATNNCTSGSAAGNAVCRIPLKYQRKSKITSSEKHYKKKFCERNWEFDCDDFLEANSEYNNTNKNSDTELTTAMVLKLSPEKNSAKEVHADKSPTKSNTVGEHAAAVAAAATVAHHHKSSKFRPKGKEWNWSHNSSSNSKTKSN